MKKMTLTLAILAIIGLSACDLIGDLAVVTIPTHYDQDFTFDLDQNTQTLDYEQTLGLTGNPDLDQYVNDKVQSYTIKSIDLKCTAYTGSETALFNGTVSYRIEGTTEETTLATITDLNLYELNNTSGTESITPDQTVLDQMGQDFLDNDAIVVHINGNVNEVPVTATVTFSVTTDVKVQPLK